MESTQQQQPANAPASEPTNTTPLASQAVPLSFPAVLNNPKSRISVLKKQGGRIRDGDGKSKGGKSEDDKGPEGKRRRRRWENATFTGNSHVRAPGPYDMLPRPPPAHPSFQPPLPLQTAGSLQITDENFPSTAESGLFKMSLKGVRKEMRKKIGRSAKEGDCKEGRVAEVCEKIEREILAWIYDSEPEIKEDGNSSRQNKWAVDGRVIDDRVVSVEVPGAPTLPDAPAALRRRDREGTPRQDDTAEPRLQYAIVESVRTEASLTWIVPNPFERFLVHAVAVYLGVVSFSKTDLFGRRITFLMRPPSLSFKPTRASRRSDPPQDNTTPISSDIHTPTTTDVDDGEDTLGDSMYDSETGLGTGSSMLGDSGSQGGGGSASVSDAEYNVVNFSTADRDSSVERESRVRESRGNRTEEEGDHSDYGEEDTGSLGSSFASIRMEDAAGSPPNQVPSSSEVARVLSSSPTPRANRFGSSRRRISSRTRRTRAGMNRARSRSSSRGSPSSSPSRSPLGRRTSGRVLPPLPAAVVTARNRGSHGGEMVNRNGGPPRKSFVEWVIYG